ncbi:hypothetical protein HOY82DRAFT_619551 [Tuber indicum]|nr:hypothetical protein HOY82DRAFT_619551 [Tuber indicum]
MKRMGRENTRAENGLRAEAESLHSRFNKLLSCPSCGANDSLRGTFIKDCAGKKDQDGRRYRRFVCRVTSTCKRSIGVTEFLQISGVGLANKSPRISSTEWTDFITADIEHKKVVATVRKELWDEIFILCNELHKARRDIEDLKCQLSEILPNSDTSRSSSTTVGHKSSEIISDKRYKSGTSTSTLSLAYTNEEPIAVKASLPLFQTQANDRQDLATTEEPEHGSIKPSRKTRIKTSTALYLEGIPYIPIVKYKLNRSFDPLSPSSFIWEGEPLPESQEAILKRNFVERLATSIASSTSSETRQHVINWSQNRGLGTQFEAQLKKHGIKISESPTAKNSIKPAPNSAQSPSLSNSPFTLPATTLCQTAPSRKRRFSLTTEVKELNYGSLTQKPRKTLVLKPRSLNRQSAFSKQLLTSSLLLSIGISIIQLVSLIHLSTALHFAGTYHPALDPLAVIMEVFTFLFNHIYALLYNKLLVHMTLSLFLYQAYDLPGSTTHHIPYKKPTFNPT